MARHTQAPIWRRLVTFLLCCTGYYFLAKPVHAVADGSPTTSKSRRLPFLPSIKSRRAAKEAYLTHLQEEVKSAQRQLYVSQNTCVTLRKRWEEQHKDTLEIIASRSRAAEGEINEEGRQRMQEQQEEIDQLQGQLKMETEKHNQQVERLNLLSAELKELQEWKDTQEQSNQGKILEYEQQLKESHEKQDNYVEQIELLALKLEAAEFAAKQRQTREGSNTSSWEERAQVLKSELESVRAKYSKMLSDSIKASATQGDGGEKQQHVEEELDSAIQLAVESALETIENDWSVRYETLEEQLNNMTEFASTLEEERDVALRQVGDAQSSGQPENNKQRSSKSSKLKQQQLREELTAELTESLTDELTERLTVQLNEKLAESIEKKYKKKMKRLRKELKEQQQAEQEESQEDTAREQQQVIEAEIKKVKEQCELEYEAKLQRLQSQSEEQVQVQKERMRKLVQALLEREAKKKGKSAGMNDGSEKAKRKKKRSLDGDSAEEMIPSSLSSSRKRAKPGVVHVRGR